MYGDDPSLQRGGTRVLVSGGSATAAWNCTQARAVGAVDVDWIAEDRQPDKQPSSAQGKRDWQALQDKLNAGVSIADVPAEEKALRAFDAAKLPRNVGGADAAFNDPKIHRSVNGIKQVTPTEDLHDPNIAPGRVKVVFSDGSFGIYDQVVVSHATNVAAPGGAQAQVGDLQFRPVVKDGIVCALESIDPPGAVKVAGGAMWMRGDLSEREHPGDVGHAGSDGSEQAHSGARSLSARFT